VSHDVIIVGARCAGATLATLLARSGVTTLLLDAGKAGSDMPLSTHFIQPPGMDVLDAIGVGDQIRACTPASRHLLARMETHDVRATFPDGRAAYCPRRSTIDPLLQAAATGAGAELRTETRVVELVKDGDRVAGVVVETARGRETLRAKLVVGADGRKSTVARLTGVEKYLASPMTRSAYFFYCPTPAIWRTDARYKDWDMFQGWEGDGMRYVFQCDGDLLLMLACPPQAEGRTWGQDYKAKTLEYLKASEITRPLAEAAEPIGKGVSFLHADFFYRRPVGPGFALVGDAGNFKDFVTGHGMTDAFLGAQRLHGTILENDESAFARYWRQRDAETLPLYLDAQRLGEVGFNDAFARLVFEHAGRSPELSARFLAVADRRISPLDAFSPGEIGRMIFSAAIRGRFDAIGAFLTTARRMAGYSREIRKRSALAETVRGNAN
jgi:flavin-dependent dehydrogenase